MSQETMLNKAETAEKRLAELKAKLEEIRKFKIEEKIKELTEENATLVIQVEKAKKELIELENLHGKKQYGKNDKQISLKKEKKDSKKKDKQPAAESHEIIDIRKLDLRIGKVIDIDKHPDADTLYVQQIDCGEPEARTVVSGLVNHVPIDQMRGRLVMVLCNLKPVKMRGITSEGMIMCASSPDKVEVLIPPNGAVPGDLVQCDGYPRDPDAQLNPKKKVFETCAPDLKTNHAKVACYKDSPLVVKGKGAVVAETLIGVSVK
ncbi:aminoacyl tRNA synthase complex-interacting multifunctional protein 1 [Epargyreus clarus]|uniref:aminoacyl tRNA synthase complex-interacting multifunctional protein 1 n=1 Tax=Epargyreus clarus TaxID=520877 RepID=UPI003C2E6D78